MKHNETSLYELTEEDRSNLWDMIVWDTTSQVNYFEEEYRVLQLDPRYLDEDEKIELNITRNKLWDQLSRWIEWEEKFSNMTSKNSKELGNILRGYEIDKILDHNLKLYYQLKELTEVTVRYDIELLCDRITNHEHFHQTRWDIKKLISYAKKYQLIYLSKEIKQIENFIDKANW